MAALQGGLVFSKSGSFLLTKLRLKACSEDLAATLGESTQRFPSA